MSRLSRSLILSIAFTGVQASAYGSDAPAQTVILPETATLSGSYTTDFSGEGGFAIVQESYNSEQASGPAASVSLTGSGASITYVPSFNPVGSYEIGAISQSVLPAAGQNGKPPSGGGTSGAITTNLNDLTIAIDFMPGGTLQGIFGLFDETFGANGGGSISNDYSGAPGSAAGGLDLTLTNSSITVNTNVGVNPWNAGAIVGQQEGGKGGAGYHEQSAGRGGGAGPLSISLTDSTVSTQGDNIYGILAQQVGGSGGVANGDDNDNSNGGIGGSGSSVSVMLAQGATGPGNIITTTGTNAAGVSASATGGDGTTGGDDGIGTSINVTPGNGGDGGNAGSAVNQTAVSVTTTGQLSITTGGSNAAGIQAMTQGGNGGAGGEGRGTGITPSTGGDGGRGDPVTVSVGSGATIKTGGAWSSAILASARGGQGGNSGEVDAVGTFAQGQPGGPGGMTGLVTVSVGDGVALTTAGDSSNGVTAQSIGGNAGDAGAITAGLGNGLGGDGGRGGDAGGVTVTSGATIHTSGDTARGILAQAMSGAGGAGGSATGATGATSGNAGTGGDIGLMTIIHSGSITTQGAFAQGILAQSISGSGGASGSASGSPFSDKGGRGAAGAAGGEIQLTHTGGVTTAGESAQGIVAQSIGGDGGTGGTAGGMISIDGGASGNGGAGGKVGLTLGSATGASIATAGTLAYGVVAQSIGGGGGLGGNAYGSGLESVISVGGTAGAGGAGGGVTIDATNLTASTTGSGAIGIVAQSIGGSGGAGGAAYATSANGLLSYSVAVGGSGGNGGAPGTVDVMLSGSTITTGLPQDGGVAQFDAIGVLAQSIGGSGGIGGGASALATAISLPYPTEDGISGTPTLSIAHATGGSGGNGGSAVLDGGAASIALGDGGQITTYGAGSIGAAVQSIGGGGGQGGDSSSMAAAVGYGSGYIPGNTLQNLAVNLSVAVGGDCTDKCAGGDGDSATLTVGDNASTKTKITTYGDFSEGALVQSIGGGGGNAGIGSANANSIGTKSTINVDVTTGSNGGSGGDGGVATATINADGVIATTGVSSTGLLAQSIGGGGGVASGGSFSVGGLLDWAKKAGETQVLPKVSLTPTINVGRTGGDGGDGGGVTVTHAGAITTAGANAAGLIAQSVGGGGGVGGTAGVAPANGTTTSSANVVRMDVEDVPLPTVYVNQTLSLGGRGGTGGEGGAVIVNLEGSISTQGDHAPALLAQSVGGGGGLGGMAVAGAGSNSILSAFAQLSFNASMSLGFNGAGGYGGHGGAVTVNVDDGLPSLSTIGDHAIGFLAQSIGGGGGVAYDGSDTPSGSVALGMTVADTSKGAGNGGAVTLATTANALAVTTQGDVSHGVVLQSVGGGGGIGATGSTTSTSDWAVNFKLGAGVGAGGDGGGVLADFGDGATNIRTRGVGAAGVIAQSVGGGGGLAAATPGQTATITQFGSLNADTTYSSNGGAVSVSLPQSESSIYTHGLGGHGVIAQSIGGGGGLFTGYASSGSAPVLTDAYTGGEGTVSNAGVGDGGSVTVDTSGYIGTSAAGAFGIVAQSIGGGGGMIANGGSVFIGHTGTNASSTAGAVTVTVNGGVSTTGENSIGVLAQSSAPGSSSAVTVNVNGTVAGGSGAQGVGILIDGGNASNQINIGKDGWVWAESGSAIKATGIYETQKVNVNNQGQIYGNTWLQGGSITGNFQNTNGTPPGEMAGTLTNSGVLVALPGQRSYIDGHLVQTAEGSIAPHLDFSTMASGIYVVTGNAVLDGKIRPNLASALPNIFLPALTVQGVATGSLTAPDSPLFSYTLRENTGQYDIAITGAQFDKEEFGLTSHHSAVANALESVFAGARAELGPFFAGLDAAAGADLGLYQAAIAEVSPRSMSTLFAQTAADASRIADASMSCPVFDAGPSGSTLTEGSCVYGTTHGQRAQFKGDADHGKSDMDSAAWQVGAQRELSSDLLLGGSLAYQKAWFDGHDEVSATGSSVQGAVTLTRQNGPILLTGALFGSYGEYDIKRQIAAVGFASTATADSPFYTAGGRARAAYTVGEDDFYLRPYLNLDVVHTHHSGFNEGSGGGLGLKISDASYTSAIVTPALEIGRSDEVWNGAILRTFLSAGVSVRSNDEWRGRGRFNAGSASDSFRLEAPLDRTTGRLSASIQLYQKDSIDLRIQYDGEFGNEATKHGATASVSYRF